MSLEIRPCTPDDYEIVHAIWCACDPDFGYTANALREHDEINAKVGFFARWVACLGGKVIGSTWVIQLAQFHPQQKFFGTVRAQAACRVQVLHFTIAW